MNVKELIEKYKRYEGKWNSKTGELARQIFLEDLKQLDEPRKIKVPQYVADWIKYFKKYSGSLYGSTAPYSYYGHAITDDFVGDVKKTLGWIRNNSETYARAWLDGYEVDEEKRYLVKIKASNQYIMSNPDENAIFFYSCKAYSKLTRKELEEAGFGWVFDCPGVEIEEVEG